MVRRLSGFFTRIMHHYLPDAYLFAISLTFISFILAMIFTDVGFLGLVQSWGQGITGILGFAMQMILILITGYALAQSAPVKRMLGKIALLAKSPAQAVFVVAFVAAVASWINWGFGLVIGGLMALEMARRHRAHFALLVAAAYSGFTIFGMGLSSSIGLITATPDSPQNYVNKVFDVVIPLSGTIFTWWNLIPAILLAVTMPFVMSLAHPKKKDVQAIDPSKIDDSKVADTEDEQKEKKDLTFSQRLENSRILNYIFFALGAIYIIGYFIHNGFNLDINTVILIFLFAGILLHGTPIAYVRVIQSAIKGTSGIALQFPVYGGIQGLMSAGLASVISGWFVAISSEHTFYLLQFLGAGLINMFVPSAGGQWITQGLITTKAAAALGMDPAKAAMSVAWGDQWTNMIQPFWALPILGMAGLKAKDIMGYTVMILIWAGLVLGAMTVVMSYL
ncbi:MAG TPA: TIGR00366 family protein [Bacillales bacterium]